MTILLTGAAGFIGFHLAKRLLESGKTVVGIDSLNSYYDPVLKQHRLDILKNYKKFSFAKMLIEDQSAVSAIWHNVQPDVVIHLAAQAGVRYSTENPMAYISANVVGFQNIIDLVRLNNTKKFVYASSSSVYGKNKTLPFSEDQAVAEPVSLYAATKISNEIVAKSYFNAYGIASVGLRFFTVYGPYSRPDMAMYKFAAAITAGRSIDIYNNGEMFRDFTYVDDIIDGVISAVDYQAQGAEIFNLGRGNKVKLGEMVTALERSLGKEAVKNFMPMQVGDVGATLADISKSARFLQYKPKVDLNEGVRHFCEWFKSAPKYGN